MSANSYNPNNLPSWLVKARQKEADLEKSLKNSPVVKIKPSKEWLSTAQYAERFKISPRAAANRLARAFSSDYYQVSKLKTAGLELSDQDYVPPSNSSLIVRCVPNSKGGKKYEVRSDSLPDLSPPSQFATPANDFAMDIPSVLDGDIPIFCDWLTMSQQHRSFDLRKDDCGNVVGIRDNSFKDMNGGFFIVLANNGNVEQSFYKDDGQEKTQYVLCSDKEDVQSVATKYLACEGSWDSRVMIRSMNGRVDFHGNIGRFKRPDNLFGYNFQDCLITCNQLLRDMGLPPFDAGVYMPVEKEVKNSNGEETKFCREWTGAVLSRIDLTTNLSFGQSTDASLFLHWLSTQKVTRMRNHTHPDGNTVEIGIGENGGKSRYIQMIAYNKAVEFMVHSTNQVKKLSRKIVKGKILDLNLDEMVSYYEQLQTYMNEMGVARLELRLKRDYLYQHENIRFLGNLQKDFGQLNEIFIKRWREATRDFEMKPIHDMDKAQKEVYALYIAGVDLSQHYKRATFYRKRNLLLDYGVDISEPYKGETTAPQLSSMRSIQVRALPVPEFYYLPKVVNL